MLDLAQTFGVPKPVFGMIHLAPLPGAPRYSGRMADILERALQDAQALHSAGVDALVIENFNDEPFFTETTAPETVAAMTLVAQAVDQATGLPIGINVLRNSWQAAMGIATVIGAAFIRLNVLTDVMVTDQGLVTGPAAQLLRYRRILGAEQVLIFADIEAKHAAPVARRPLAVVARDMVERGGADALLVSGHSSADPPRTDDIRTLRAAVPEVPLIIGSGMSLQTVELLAEADGTIFGFGSKPDLKAPVDPQMAQAFMGAARRLQATPINGNS